MRILIINNFFTPEGGAETIAFSTYKQLQDAGHEVVFFATNKTPYFIPDYDYSRYFPSYVDYDTLRGLSQKFKNISRIFYNQEAANNLMRLLQDFKPDLVHCHNIYFHLTPSILSVCQKAGIPVVMTLHDVRLFCPAGTLLLNGKTPCVQELCVGSSGLPCIQHRCYQQSLSKSGIVSLNYHFHQFRNSYNMISQYITPSEALRDLAIRGGIAPERVVCIENFLSDELIDESVATTSGGYFLFVGRLAPEKGVSTLLAAMAQLPNDIPLHIVGTGPDEQLIKEQIKTLGLSNVTMKGYLSGNALKDEFRNALAVVVPSEWFEIFGLSIIEGYAFSKPVIGSDIGAITGLIEHEKTGLLFPAGNDVELAKAMKCLYEHPEKRIRYGNTAKRLLANRFSPMFYIQKLVKIYTDASRQTSISAI